MNNNVIKVDTSILPLGKDEIDIKPNGKLSDLNRQTMIEVLGADEVKENEDYRDILKKQQKAKNDSLTLTKKALSLTTKEIDKINEAMDDAAIDNYCSYVMALIEGLTTGSYKDYQSNQANQAEEDQNTDPKKSVAEQLSKLMI